MKLEKTHPRSILDTQKLGYSVKEACHATSLGRSTIWNYIKNGRLRATRVGGRTIIPADSLHSLIAGEA